MANINEHKFKFSLPMHSHQRMCDVGMPETLEMDGKPLKGVKELTIRAGVSGFTNIVMEFDSSCAVELAGHLVAHMEGASEDRILKLAGIYKEAKAEIDAELDNDGSLLEQDFIAQGQFVRRIIEMAIEQLK